jgi:4a-hydroxytetrahydrobiopterin dehydratase
MKRELLTQTKLETALTQLDGWTTAEKTIARRWEFANFADALAFVNKIGAIAEDADHHPDVKLGWGYCEVELTTHDRGGVTDVDIDVARKFNAVG